MLLDVTQKQESFPKTEWSLVSAAGQPESHAKQMALESVLVRYLPVLKSHLAAQYRVSPDQASDWLQSFVLKKVIEKDLISQADQTRGKFRTFILKALHNFVIQQIRHEQAGKRAPVGEFLVIDDMTEHELAGTVVERAQSFDVAWARGVLAEALQRMERQCDADGRTDVWGVFECRILKPLFEESEPLAYEELVTRFNLQSPAQASNVLITAKRMFARCLRTVVSEYASGSDDVEREIDELKEILFKA